VTGIVGLILGAGSVQSEGQTEAKLLDWTIAARMRGIIGRLRLWITEWCVKNVLRRA